MNQKNDQTIIKIKTKKTNVKSKKSPLLTLGDRWIYSLWGGRHYAKNRNDRLSLGLMIFFSFALLVDYLFYRYWPFHLMSVPMAIGVFVGVLCVGIQQVNRAPYLPFYFIGLGAVLWLLPQQFPSDMSLTFGDVHLERGLDFILIVAGVMAGWRWGWNAWVWRQLDRISHQQQKKQKE